MGARIRAFDWERSPLGPISSWSQSLKSTVDLMMASQLAMNLIWGPERIQIYNDANRVFMGTKHPGALGRPGREDWGEVWEAAEAIHHRVFAGETITLEDHPWTLLRNGYPEETFFMAFFTPIRDETGAVAGNLVIGFETTEALKEKAERARAEQELRKSEARLQAAVDLLKLGCYEWKSQTNELQWDDTLLPRRKPDCRPRNQPTSQHGWLRCERSTFSIPHRKSPTTISSSWRHRFVAAPSAISVSSTTIVGGSRPGMGLPLESSSKRRAPRDMRDDNLWHRGADGARHDTGHVVFDQQPNGRMATHPAASIAACHLSLMRAMRWGRSV